jgi:23S rRNA pseudouridine2605 synthase
MQKPKGEKLQKVLARIGLGSRREIEQWIQQGRLSINANRAKLGDRVETQDKVKLDGRLLRLKESDEINHRVIMYHKPAGEMCSRRDPEGRPTIYDALPSVRGKRWVSVGRLDFNTSGLLLLTTDGELANQLMHPGSAIEREYAVRVLGNVSPQVLQRLRTGVRLEDGMAHFDEIRDAGGEGANHWYHVILREGRNREVRRLFESQNVRVSRLIRVRFGCVTLPRFLRFSQFRDLEKSEVAELMKLLTPLSKRSNNQTRGESVSKSSSHTHFEKKTRTVRRIERNNDRDDEREDGRSKKRHVLNKDNKPLSFKNTRSVSKTKASKEEKTVLSRSAKSLKKPIRKGKAQPRKDSEKLLNQNKRSSSKREWER